MPAPFAATTLSLIHFTLASGATPEAPFEGSETTAAARAACADVVGGLAVCPCDVGVEV